MSCLPADTFSHFEQRISNFEQREQEILARDAQIEAKRVQVISQATSVMQEAEGPILVPKTPPQNGAEVTVEAASPSDAGLPMDQGVMPTSMGGSEALHTTIRLQNARILQLSEELDKAISETCQKDSEVQQLRQEQKQVNDEVKRLQKTNASLEQNQEKMKKQLSSAESRVKELELERAELVKAKDHLDLKVKKTEADSSSKEARLNRLMEESEKLKAAAKDANLQEISSVLLCDDAPAEWQLLQKVFASDHALLQEAQAGDELQVQYKVAGKLEVNQITITTCHGECHHAASSCRWPAPERKPPGGVRL